MARLRVCQTTVTFGDCFFVSGVCGVQSFDHTGMTGVCEHIQDKTNISRAHHVLLQHDHAHNVRCVHPIPFRSTS